MEGDKRKNRRRIIIALLIALGIPLAMFVPKPRDVAFILGGFWYAEHARVRLLCETDHQALLEPSRELSRRVATGELKPGRYRVFIEAAPEASTFPKPTLVLSPSYVYIDEYISGRVMLEMLGGLGHFGVEAYSEDFNEPWPNFEYGDRELVPGLWYYDDAYDDNPTYAKKKIEALLQKRK
jgi:hypothetical protein